jgi:exodeoxyribonuclease VII small subunit
MPNKEPKKLSYEDALEKLESIIEAMEEGSTPLAELVAQFEEGAKLLKICQNELKAAELKISKLDISNDAKEPLDI